MKKAPSSDKSKDGAFNEIFEQNVSRVLSVGDHLSRPIVAYRLKRLHEAWRATILEPKRLRCSHINLAPSGVYRADKSPSRR